MEKKDFAFSFKKRMLRDCIAPPGATISYTLINRADRGFEWQSIIPRSQFIPPSQRIYHKSSPCRDFHHWLYVSSRGYEDAKYNLNKEGMFLLYDKSTNHVRIVIKDLEYPDDKVPLGARRVSVPAQFINLKPKPNYAPAIAGGVLSAAAVAGGITYGILKPKQGASNSNTNPNQPTVNPNGLKPSVPAQIIEEEKKVDGFVKPVELTPKDAYVSALFPGTFWNLNENQKIILRRAIVSQAGQTYPVTLDELGVKAEIYIGSLDTAIRIVWPQADPDTYLTTLSANQPPVYYYQAEDNTWKYFRGDPEKRLIKWSEGVYVDPEFPLDNSKVNEFMQAYDRCKRTIMDFQHVNKLHNIFQIIKQFEDEFPREKKSDTLVSMMESSHIMMTQGLKRVLNLTLQKVLNYKDPKTQAAHPLADIYKSLGTWDKLAERLLTKRVLWYYGNEDLWGCYEGANLEPGKGFKSYLGFVKDRLGQYLHPDESVISALLGLKVPSFAYDSGQRVRACQVKRPQPDKREVVMLPQVGVRLEPHSRLEYGDLFLMTGANVQTPFQQALNQGLRELYPEITLYESRCRMVIQQAVNAAVNHDKPTHLILTGLGQGVWQGGYGAKTVPLFSNALIAVIRDLKNTGNLTFMTVMDYKANQFSIEEMKQACQDKFNFEYEPTDTTPIFGRQHGLVDMFSFAWDGMSLVGNEYYDGLCHQSADPAAAYSTSVAFVSHPRINPEMYKRFAPGFLEE